MNIYVALISAAVLSFLIAFLLGFVLIPWLRKLKFGQTILDIGPAWHKSKQGTPVMGGIMFIVSTILSTICVLVTDHFLGGNLFGSEHILPDTLKVKLVAGIILAIGLGFVGFADDYIKVVKKRNLGLTAKQKFSLQVLVSLVFTSLIAGFGVIDMSVLIPFTGKYVNLGYMVLPLDIVVMLATVNSVNLTDGLDGLAATVTVLVATFFALAAEKIGNSVVFTVSAAIIGALLGFLVYNKYPAKVFMGDTGSLFLGGLLSAIAVYMRNPFILLIVGFVYVAESLSVIIQVTYFKKTGKRIFKMSPIHHHFEMCGLSEKKIVLLFSAVTLVLGIIGYFGV